MNDLISNYNVFESIKHIDEFGFEYWESRELIFLDITSEKFFTIL